MQCFHILEKLLKSMTGLQNQLNSEHLYWFLEKRTIMLLGQIALRNTSYLSLLYFFFLLVKGGEIVTALNCVKNLPILSFMLHFEVSC